MAARFRNDDGNETTATFRQAQNTNDTIALDTPFRVRFLIDNTTTNTWTSINWKARISRNAAAYSTVVAQCPYTLSPNFAQGDDSTSQLTGGSGTFLTDNNGMQDLGFTTNSGASQQFFEIEVCFTLSSADGATVGDTYDFRIYNETAAAAIAAYTFTPRMTAIAAPATGVPRRKPFNYQPFLAQ